MNIYILENANGKSIEKEKEKNISLPTSTFIQIKSTIHYKIIKRITKNIVDKGYIHIDKINNKYISKNIVEKGGGRRAQACLRATAMHNGRDGRAFRTNILILFHCEQRPRTVMPNSQKYTKFSMQDMRKILRGFIQTLQF